MTSGSLPPESRFLGLVGEETRQLRAFIELLQREQQILRSSEIEPLAELARLKGEAAGRLAALAGARGQFLAGAGALPGSAGLGAWLDRQPGADKLRGAWQALLDLAEQAHALNTENGALVKTRLAHNQQALAVLLAASDQAALYGPDGQARAVAAGRRIDSA